MFKMEAKEVSKVWGLDKGKRCSLYYHKNKDETFYVESGIVLMEIKGKEKIMKQGDVARIKQGVKHRFSGLENSVIIEISTHHEDKDSCRKELSGDIPIEIVERYKNA